MVQCWYVSTVEKILKRLRAGCAVVDRWEFFKDAPETPRQKLMRKLLDSKCIQPAKSTSERAKVVQKMKDNEQNHV